MAGKPSSRKSESERSMYNCYWQDNSELGDPFGSARRMARPIACIPTIATESMDDLYGNAWGDPVNDYSSKPVYPPPTWIARSPSPQPPSPAEDDQNDSHVNGDENEDLAAAPQSPTDAPDASWTADSVPWPVEESQSRYSSAWAPASPANVWSSTAQPQTPTIPTPVPSDDVPPKYPSPASLSLPEEPEKEHPTPLEQPQDTPVQSRAPSPDQFGTFESGTLDATVPVEGSGWDSPKYSTFDDNVDSSDAWGQQVTTKERDTEAEPVDEWEAARRMKEIVDRRVVRILSCPLI